MCYHGANKLNTAEESNNCVTVCYTDSALPQSKVHHLFGSKLTLQSRTVTGGGQAVWKMRITKTFKALFLCQDSTQQCSTNQLLNQCLGQSGEETQDSKVKG